MIGRFMAGFLLMPLFFVILLVCSNITGGQFIGNYILWVPIIAGAIVVNYSVNSGKHGRALCSGYLASMLLIFVLALTIEKPDSRHLGQRIRAGTQSEVSVYGESDEKFVRKETQ